MNETYKRTLNHEKIRQWIIKRGGMPAKFKETTDDNRAGDITVAFPGYKGEAAYGWISWNDFFKAFEVHRLVFIYRELDDKGNLSRDFHFFQWEEGLQDPNEMSSSAEEKFDEELRHLQMHRNRKY